MRDRFTRPRRSGLIDSPCRAGGRACRRRRPAGCRCSPGRRRPGRRPGPPRAGSRSARPRPRHRPAGSEQTAPSRSGRWPATTTSVVPAASSTASSASERHRMLDGEVADEPKDVEATGAVGVVVREGGEAEETHGRESVGAGSGVVHQVLGRHDEWRRVATRRTRRPARDPRRDRGGRRLSTGPRRSSEPDRWPRPGGRRHRPARHDRRRRRGAVHHPHAATNAATDRRVGARRPAGTRRTPRPPRPTRARQPLRRPRPAR